jgi:lipoyl-dependent peroxiredoxin
MPKRKAGAKWFGTLKGGKGSMKLGSGAFEGAFSFGTRFEESPGTNPEELIGAALAGCYSMALSAELEKAGYTPVSVETASVTAIEVGEAGAAITSIALETKVKATGVTSAEFAKIAEATKSGCPVSKALTGTKITLQATLLP